MYKKALLVLSPFVALVGLALPASATLATTPKPVVVSFAASSKAIPSAGGSIRLTVKVRYATSCIFGGAGQVTKKCTGGKAVITDNLVANTSAAKKSSSIWIYAKGKGGRSARKMITLTQAAAPTSCTGTCKFTFGTVDDDDVASIALNSVSQAIAWPNPNPYSTGIPIGDQLDAINVTVCAGSTGIATSFDPVFRLSLALSNGGQASEDFDAGDGTTGTDISQYGPIAPGQCLTGNLYYDVPGGVSWTTVNFSYQGGINQLVYVWHA